MGEINGLSEPGARALASNSAAVSRATSPGGGLHLDDPELQKLSRGHPKTFDYKANLPYETEGFEKEQEVLNEIIRGLYIAIKSDFNEDTTYWIREVKQWLGLKFTPTKEQRIKLAKLSYEMALAPGLDPNVAERFAGLFYLLVKRKHYLRPVQDLVLDWRPIFQDLKPLVLPQEPGLAQSHGMKRSPRTLLKMCMFAQMYFDPAEIPAMLEEFLPYFNTSSIEGAYSAVGLLNLMFPTAFATVQDEKLLPQHYFPSFFHLWATVNRSKVFDMTFIDLLSRIARDMLTVKGPFSEFGIFTREQVATVFTAMLRLSEIPVGQSGSVYSTVPDSLAGSGMILERDQRKYPVAHSLARWIVMSLSPISLDKPVSVMTELEALIQSVETFFHPSNSGAWTKPLAQFVFYLADFFVMRWNREASGEMDDVPSDRRLNDALKKRFVACLQDVVFMGIYTKSSSAMSFYLSTLQSLALLEPSLILPGALQRIYPSMQGLVEVHRTTSSLRALQVLSPIMIREKGFRCHVTTLLGLALPGIDANDLEKTQYTLQYLQAVCYNIPFHNLAGKDGGSELAMQWVTGEMERMEHEGANFAPDYADELTDEDEEAVLKSSTAGFAEFVSSFLGRVFTLLENLPDAARARNGSPEENVMHTLPACFTPLLTSLSPDLYDSALNKVAEWVNNHVVHQARDAMAFICNCFCKVDPEKALKRFIPMLITSIRAEIDENGAASTRNAGGEVLPRDRAFLWHVSILSMCSVHVGEVVLPYKDDLMQIAMYMQQKCRGSPTVHISNFIHHLLLNLTSVYPLDWQHYEHEKLGKGLQAGDWGARTDMKDLNIKWHRPKKEELQFAFELFEAHAAAGTKSIKSLLDGTSGLKKDTKNWSDDLTRDLNLLRLLTSGVASLFDNAAVAGDKSVNGHVNGDSDRAHEVSGHVDVSNGQEESEDSILELDEGERSKATFLYSSGYPLVTGEDMYNNLHKIRGSIGEVLHEVHQFLVKEKEDDVPCFTALCSAYKYWISDVGIEKTAHTLDRVTRLYAAEIQPYKMAGLRKRYPRAILLRRAYVYHLQRQRYNAHSRRPSDLDKVMLRDLATSCVSTYTDVRKTAQSALDSACKCLLGVRPMLIRDVLRSFDQGLEANDYEKIKGSMHILVLGCLAKTVGKDWRFTPNVIRNYLAACDIDNLTIQKMCSSATFPIMDFSRHKSPYVHYSEQTLDNLRVPELDATTRDDMIRKAKRLAQRRDLVVDKKRLLADELVEMAKTAHWKTASRIAAIVISLGLRFLTLASDNLAELLAKGAVDVHPGLRSLYTGAFVALLSLVHTRAACGHSIEKFVVAEDYMPGRIQVETQRDEPGYTDKYLESFAQPHTDHFVDHAHIGWLTWKDKYTAVSSDVPESLEYDDLEKKVLAALGKCLDREWFSTYFKYLLQEPRDQAADRFRSSSTVMLAHTFDYVLEGRSAISMDELKKEIELAYADGSTKHQHRTLAEIFAGLLGAVYCAPRKMREDTWAYVMPKVLKIFKDELTPENSGYWLSFIHVIFRSKDPRRSWQMLEWLADFRLDMSSNAAFKESSKIQLLQECLSEVGWHFQLDKPILKDFLTHLDHPYKAVREAIGGTLSTIYRSRYHESYRDVASFVEHQKDASPLGSRPWQPTEEFTETIREVFERIEKWRQEREPGQQTPSSYTNGSKTVLIWLDGMLASQECTLLQPFFPDFLLEPLLHMMDIKEDQELQVLAYHVFRQIPNIPHRTGEESALVDAMIRIGRTSPFWHQRLRVLVNVQVFYFRRLFLMTDQQMQALYSCVSDMLADAQLEVRMGAMTTLSGMIRCSRAALRDTLTENLISRFTKSLLSNPLPKRPNLPRLPSGLNTPGGSSPGGVSTPTPEHTKLVLTRHAAVLGLGALVQAHPYTSPPPSWVPGVLTTLANKANNDPGVVGKSVKTILADFKKTRQDTWAMDLKAFTPEQVEDLEGVLWKSYFA